MIELYGIRIDTQNIHELDEDQPALSFAVADVEAVVLRFGHTAERPLLGVLFGAILILAGLVVSAVVVPDAFHRQFFSTSTVGLLGTAPVTSLIGLWLVRFSLRSGHYLEVSTTSGKRKLRFESCVSDDELLRFLEQARSMGDWASRIHDS